MPALVAAALLGAGGPIAWWSAGVARADDRALQPLETITQPTAAQPHTGPRRTATSLRFVTGLCRTPSPPGSRRRFPRRRTVSHGRARRHGRWRTRPRREALRRGG